jgi:hypothetical protein
MSSPTPSAGSTSVKRRSHDPLKARRTRRPRVPAAIDTGLKPARLAVLLGEDAEYDEKKQKFRDDNADLIYRTRENLRRRAEADRRNAKSKADAETDGAQ